MAPAAKGQEEEGEKGIEAFDRQVILYPSAVLKSLAAKGWSSC